MGIKGRICNQDITFLVDSLSAVTILSWSVYQSIPGTDKPPLSPCEPLTMADGSLMKVYGSAKMNIEINSKNFDHNVIVANADVPAMIGIDFLREHNCTTDFGTNTLVINESDVDTVFVGMTKTNFPVCKVSVAENILVPAKSEMIIPGRVHCKGDVPKDGLVETAFLSNARRGLWAAKAYVTVDNRKVPILVRNPNDEPVQLYKGTTTALLHPVTELPVSVNTVNKTDVQETDVQEPDVENTQENNSPKDEACEELPEHMQPLWEDGKKLLSDDQAMELKKLLGKYSNVFSKDKSDTGVTAQIEHTIDTGDHPPIKQAPRRLPMHKQDAASEEIKEMLQDNIVRPSNSPWSSPVVLVEKKDKSIRFCIDFRKLNDVTIKDSFPLPRTDDCLDALGGSKWFSSLDLNRAYWQVPIAEKDKHKTAFADRSGLYEFNVMAYGLCGAPATFERLMNTVLAGLQWEQCLVFLDDIIVFADSYEQMLERLETVFKRLGKSNLKLKPKKCFLFHKELNYLGHVVSVDGVKPDPEKVKVINEWPTPQSSKEVHSFVQLCSYLRRFIPNFAAKAKPLYQLINQEFEWTTECEEAFRVLKDEITSANVLAYPDKNKIFVLDTDASEWAIGSVISHVIDGKERPVAYASRTLNATERKYSSVKRELLALKHFIKHFHTYLYGAKFIARTDHKPLIGFLNKSEDSGDPAMCRWKMIINSYEVDLRYREGRKHSNADAMSRIPERCEQYEPDIPESVQPETDKTSLEDKDRVAATRVKRPTDVKRKQRSQGQPRKQKPAKKPETWLQGRSNAELQDAQRQDKDIAPILKAMDKSPNEPKWEDISPASSATKELWSQWDQLTLIDGVLYRKYINSATEVSHLQLIVPKTHRKEVFELCHTIKTSGHLGIHKTVSKIRQRCYWPKLKDDVRLWCKQCYACGKSKAPKKRPKAKLNQYISGTPNERIGVDLLKLPETRDGNQYCVVITDYFTKWAEAIPIPNKESETVARVVVNEYLCRHGGAREFHSDQGNEFEARLFKEILELLGIHKTRTTAGNPKSDGQTERFNRTLTTMIRSYADDHTEDWDAKLPQLMCAYRSSVHESTGLTPNFMTFGHEIYLPIDMLYGLPTGSEPKETTEYAQEVRTTLTDAFQFAREHLEMSAKRQKVYYDKRTRGQQYKEDDLVWLTPLSRRKKLDPIFLGPYIVTKKLSRARYIIQLNIHGAQKVVHFDRLYPYESSFIPQWIQDTRSGNVPQPINDQNQALDIDNEPSDMESEEGEEDGEELLASANREPQITQFHRYTVRAPELTTRAGRQTRPPQILDL